MIKDFKQWYWSCLLALSSKSSRLSRKVVLFYSKLNIRIVCLILKKQNICLRRTYSQNWPAKFFPIWPPLLKILATRLYIILSNICIRVAGASPGFLKGGVKRDKRSAAPQGKHFYRSTWWTSVPQANILFLQN